MDRGSNGRIRPKSEHSNPPDLTDLTHLGTPPDPPDPGPVPDLIDTLRRTKEATGHSAEATIGGYAAEHDRPAAFEGSDGQPYTVDVAVAPSEDSEQPYAAYLLFLRWAMTGAGIMGHIESEDVAHGSTEEEALRLARELTLYEAKVELDAAIERRRAEGEE